MRRDPESQHKQWYEWSKGQVVKNLEIIQNLIVVFCVLPYFVSWSFGSGLPLLLVPLKFQV